MTTHIHIHAGHARTKDSTLSTAEVQATVARYEKMYAEMEAAMGRLQAAMSRHKAAMQKAPESYKKEFLGEIDTSRQKLLSAIGSIG